MREDRGRRGGDIRDGEALRDDLAGSRGGTRLERLDGGVDDRPEALSQGVRQVLAAVLHSLEGSRQRDGQLADLVQGARDDQQDHDDDDREERNVDEQQRCAPGHREPVAEARHQRLQRRREQERDEEEQDDAGRPEETVDDAVGEETAA